MYELLPKALKESAGFCLWKRELINERWTKVPYQITGKRAMSTIRKTFSPFAKVKAVFDKGGYDGIGLFVEPRFSAIDIDDCVSEDGLSELAEDIVNRMDSYTEYSPSGKGIRIFIDTTNVQYDKKPYYVLNKRINTEVYTEKKFVSATGNVLLQKEIRKCGDEFIAFMDTYMKKPVNSKQAADPTGSFLSDTSVIERALGSASGEKFRKLWSGDTEGYASESEAELALCSHLAFFCGGDKDQMDRLMRQSGLYRDKWDRDDYRERTMEKAISGCKEFYRPLSVSTAMEDFDPTVASLVALNAASNKRYGMNDIGFGRLFADVFKPIARYVEERKKWFVYDGTRWFADAAGLRIAELGKKLADALLVYAAGLHDEEQRKKVLDWCKRWVQRRFRDLYIREAQSIYPLSMSVFDQDAFLFNCANCTLDIRTGSAHEHTAEDYITKLSPVSYDASASYPRWERFIREIMSGDDAKIRYLQKTLGYGLTGSTSFECMFFYYGETTRNGKGTLVESILPVMGEYGLAVRPETIAQKNNSNSHSPSEDIARLAGIRFANISEPARGMMLNAAQIKAMTGNDTLNARFLNENSFDFKSRFKLYVNTNYLPVINDMTLFTSGRIVIVPFNRHFEASEQDKGLKDEFLQPYAQSAILNWLIEGYRMLSSEGFDQPDTVRDAIDAFYHDSNKTVQFMEDRLIEDPPSEIRTAAVYDAYRSWCTENGCYTENNRNFLSELRKHGKVVRKRPEAGGEKTTLLIGYKLQDNFLR